MEESRYTTAHTSKNEISNVKKENTHRLPMSPTETPQIQTLHRDMAPQCTFTLFPKQLFALHSFPIATMSGIGKPSP